MKRLLTLFALLVGLTTQAQIPSYVPTEGLVGYWGFNGNANDESGNENDGIVNGASLSEGYDGAFNSAYYFDGEDDNILLPQTTSLESGAISLWFIRTVDEVGYLFDCRPNSSTAGMACVMFENSVLEYGMSFQGSYDDIVLLEDEVIALSEWHHMVCSHVEGFNQLYLDGQLIHEGEGGEYEYFSYSNLLLGSRYSDSDWLNGGLDNVGVWNRALTEEEVLALYNGCSVSIETIAGDLTPFTLEENTYNCTNTPNSTYEWEVEGGVITSGQGSSTVTVLWAEEGAGSLTVTETTEDGCDGSVSIEVEIVCSISATAIEGPLGPGELLEVTYTCDGDASSTYNWSISNGVITSGQGTNSVTVIWASTGLGSISVQETTSAECDGEEITLDVVVVLGTGIDETLAETINIFPNPASTSVTITIDESLINSDYQLLDAQGKLVSEGVLSKTNTTLNTTGFASGNYVISISNDQGVVRKQIIIER